MEQGSVLDAVRNGRPRISGENIEHVRQAFSHSMKFICIAARELQLPPATVHKVLCKRLQLYTYKMQMLQALQPNDKTDELEEMDQFDGHHVHQTLLPWTFFCGVT